MNEHSSPARLNMWRFVRGDVGPLEFEQWVYAETNLEQELGDKLYLNVISTVFADKNAV